MICEKHLMALGAVLDNGQWYVVPGEQALITVMELKELQDISSHFLKFYAEQSDPQHWEQTCIPEIAELYSGSRACLNLIEELKTVPPPPEFRDRVTGGGLCLSGEQYIGLTSLLQGISALKKSVGTNYNISFEIH